MQGGTNLVLFDADTRENGGGFAIRKRKLLQQKEELGIEFDLFLWPNNHADGDFESLLMHLINPRHKGLIDCYRRYEKGISRMNRSHKMYMTQGRKGCIYSYIAAMKKNPVLKYVRTAKAAKTFNILANVGLSSYLLACVLPEAQFAFREWVTGSKLEPGLIIDDKKKN